MPSESEGYAPTYRPDDLIDVAQRTVRLVDKLKGERENLIKIVEKQEKEIKELRQTIETLRRLDK
jgi:hypothetical protein